MMKQLTIVGDYSPDRETHIHTDQAISHALGALSKPLSVEWVGTDSVNEKPLRRSDGLWICTGSPYRNLQGALTAIKYARENKIPCLGTCSGFQHIIIEYAIHVLGLKDVGHGEYDAGKENLVISSMKCSMRGKRMEVFLEEESKIRGFYQAPEITERYYCSYGINPKFEAQILEGPIRATGRDQDGEIRVVEYEGHPMMLATLFVPQASSTEVAPNPIVAGFLKAIVEC